MKTDTPVRHSLRLAMAPLFCSAWLALVGCGKVESPPLVADPARPTQEQTATIEQTPPQAMTTPKAEAGVEKIGDPYAFELQISLSDDAAAALAPAKEGVVALISYEGDPAPGVAASLVDEVGFVDLGNSEVDVSGKSKVLVDGSALKKDMLKYLQGEPRVNVNIASARRTFEDNVLNCSSFDDDIKVAVAKPVVLHCELLERPSRRTQ